MQAAASLQLHRPAPPLQRARAPSGAGSGRWPHSRWVAAAAPLIRRPTASLLHRGKSDLRCDLLVYFRCRPLAHRVAAAAVKRQQQPDESSSGENNDSSQPKRGRGAISRTLEPQPQLQAWLQQEQGLSAKAADQHARRLALVFGSQQAALDSLPATFEWCRSRGLTGLQTAQLLDRIAELRRENVVQFGALVQPVWQQLEGYIAAWAEQERQAGDSKMRKNTSLAEVLCGNEVAAAALAVPPGHVEAWLAAVSQRLPKAAIGRLLLSMPNMVCSSPATALAAIRWAADVLGVADPAAFFVKAPKLLKSAVSTLQRNLDSLQQALGWTAHQVQQLVAKQPGLLSNSPATVQAALAWLRQLFPDAEQLVAVVDRGPQLLFRSVQHLQGNADYLRQALGWQDGDSQLVAYVAARPQDFATIDLSSEDTQHKLQLLGEVVGVSIEQCLTSCIGYLNRRLENIAARYMLVQVRVHWQGNVALQHSALPSHLVGSY